MEAHINNCVLVCDCAVAQKEVVFQASTAVQLRPSLGRYFTLRRLVDGKQLPTYNFRSNMNYEVGRQRPNFDLAFGQLLQNIHQYLSIF
jgi:hypothetical protein